MTAIGIAWNIRSDALAWPLTFEKKVEIFYERTLGWQLHIADLLINGGQPLGTTDTLVPIRHSGFAVLHICLSYFETIGHYQKGYDGKKAFKAGVQSVFPQLSTSYGADADELLDRLYSGARCGLYHNSMTVPGLGLGQPTSGEAMEYDPTTKRLAISPERLPRVLEAHLEQFREKLLDPSNLELRKKFEWRFDQDN